ncbi:MAG: uroporphyrinogen-III synthase [Hyphomicrobiales bacterium]|nr:uroporphyrinogen-III synthase [Hyphomicrobiales bacterium]
MRVLVTRAEDQGRATEARLAAAGLDGIVAPLVRIVLDGDVALPLDGVQALVVTSINGVAALALCDDVARLTALPLFAVGDKTAEAARARGFVDVHSAAGDRRALAELLKTRLDPARGALLWAAGADRAADFAADLEAAGFEVRIAEVYRSEAVADLPDAVATDLAGGRIDAIAVYSPRSAEILVDALAARGFSPSSSRFRIHAISDAAAEPLRRAGYDRIVVAERPDESGLIVTFVQSRVAPPGDDGENSGRPHMASKKEPVAAPEGVSEATEAPPSGVEPVVEAAEAVEATPATEPEAVEPETVAAAEAASDEAPLADAAAPVADAPETIEPKPAEAASEPKPEPAEAPATPSVTPPATRSGVGAGGLVVGMLVAAIGGGVIGVGLPHWFGPKLDALLGPVATTPAAPDPALKTALDRLAALETKLAAAEKAAAEAKPIDLSPIEKRLAAIETAPALKLPADLADRVAGLQKAAEERLAAAKTSVSESLAKLPAGDGQALGELAAKVDQAIAAARESAAAETARLAAEIEAARADLKARAADGGETAKAAVGDAAARLAAEVEKQKADVAAALDGFRQRLGGLEGLRSEVDGLVGRVGGMETSNAEAKADRGRIAETLDKTLEATEGRVGLVESKVAEIEVGAAKAAKAQTEAVFAVALADLKSAVDAGRPFGPELDVVKRAAPEGLPMLAPLDGFAAAGVPSVTRLREDLPKIARAMIDAVDGAPKDASLFDRMWSHAAHAVRIRPAGETAGEGVGEKISRIESRMVGGDLPAALAAWKDLPEAARKASATWGAALEARVAVDAALKAQTSTVVSKLSQPK